MRILLAPMEGVVDDSVRHFLTQLGGIDECVTEFIRVTNHLLPVKVFHRLCPELLEGCRTKAGVPVKVQLLGSNPQALADNALRAVELGAYAVDLNFGCPAKTVNNSDGGASLLRTPCRVEAIVHAVRQAVPSSVPVTAKIRLGYDDRNNYLENALATWQGGASELVVHARSKADGYKPPAYWNYLADIREKLPINVVANGEIWTIDDWKQCKEESGCTDFMIGRGLMACPDLALQIQACFQQKDVSPLSWQDIAGMLYAFYCATEHRHPPKYLGNRLKQWLMYLRRTYPEADAFFERIKKSRDSDFIHSEFTKITQSQQPLPQALSAHSATPLTV